MNRWRRLAGPGVMALVMLVLLIGLGVWQLHRLAWKQGVLGAIDRAEASPSIPLPSRPSPFQKVAVTGVFRPDLHLLYGSDVRDTRQGPVLGGQLIQPLIRADGPPVLVERGWISDQPNAAIATPAGRITVEGYIREPDHAHLFSPRDDAAARRFYTLNPAAMAASLGLQQVAPFTLVALGRPSAPGDPVPATALPRPPNDHLSYAITWFGLALVLAVVFTIWARRALQTPTEQHLERL